MQRHKLYPTRAMFAENSEGRATATWEFKDGWWYCCSASKHLKWMKGMKDFGAVEEQLNRRGFIWNWIVPLYNPSPVKPPFVP